MPAVDFATNKVVANFYNSTNAKRFRTAEDYQNFLNESIKKKYITIGIDYYIFYFKVIDLNYLTYILNQPYKKKYTVNDIIYMLKNGKVFVIKLSKDGMSGGAGGKR